jgi:glycosyltransferase involved in cell wall biosynthesis
MSILSAVSVAGNKMQLGFLRGLYKNTSEIKAFSVKPYKMWNGKGKIFVKGKESLIDEKIQLKQVSFSNIPIIKQITIFISIFVNLLLWCLDNHKDPEKVIIVYNTISYFAYPSLLITKIFKCKSAFIVADLPIKNPSKKIVQKFEDSKEIDLIRKCDLLIPLTEEIAKKFGNKQPYFVVEAGLEEKYIKEVIQKKSNEIFNIVFSGSLNQLSGIELAVGAMNHINDDSIKLNIYGKGVLEDYVIKSSNANSNIIFHGSISNDKMIEIQRNSDLLICPRIPDDFTTRYTFPSKIVEYMATGVPVLCNKLKGIPNEYYEYITSLDKADELLFAKTIESIREDNSSQYNIKAKKAREFILENKTWEKLAPKIFYFLKQI